MGSERQLMLGTQVERQIRRRFVNVLVQLVPVRELLTTSRQVEIGTS